jgi:hypothetical protein
MYHSKEECFSDTLLSLRLGIIQEEELKDLLSYYRDYEHYECCAGVVEAYVEFKNELKRINKDERRDIERD